MPVDPERIWDIVADPKHFAELTPLVDRVVANGDVWTWTLAGIARLGIDIAPRLTERMTLTPISRIEFRHDPPPGRSERAGVMGSYQITRAGDQSSKLAIDLTLCLELPLPDVSKHAGEKIMDATMARTAGAFARNLYRHLDIDPREISIRVIEGESGS